MNHLKIVVNFQTMPEKEWGEPREIIPPRRLEVKIEFTLSKSVDNLPPNRLRSVTITMEARDRHDSEDQLRDELKQNARADYEWFAFATIHQEQPDDDWQIEIIDPHGVLKWFGIDQAVDLFKQQTQKHDQLVRLPAPAAK